MSTVDACRSNVCSRGAHISCNLTIAAGPPAFVLHGDAHGHTKTYWSPPRCFCNQQARRPDRRAPKRRQSGFAVLHRPVDGTDVVKRIPGVRGPARDRIARPADHDSESTARRVSPISHRGQQPDTRGRSITRRLSSASGEGRPWIQALIRRRNRRQNVDSSPGLASANEQGRQSPHEPPLESAPTMRGDGRRPSDRGRQRQPNAVCKRAQRGRLSREQSRRRPP